MLCALTALLWPRQAAALPLFDDPLGLESWMAGIVAGAANSLFNLMGSALSAIIDGSIINRPFDALINDPGATQSLYTLIREVNRVAVKPLAASLLSVVMLAQVVKIAQKMDSNQVMPAIKEVGMLFVFCTLFMVLINYSLDICAGLYELLRSITNSVVELSPGFGDEPITFVVADDITSIPVAVGLLIIAYLCFSITLLSVIITILCAYARALQIYILAAFSPLPFALLGFEETRSWGVGFFKNFASLCLAGTIMVLLLVAFPYMMASVVGSSTIVDVATGSLTQVLSALAITLVLAFGTFKAGAWARDIFGS
jgi:hypothetical protein